MNEFVGINSIKNLADILESQKISKILIFTGKKSFEKIKKILEQYVNNYICEYYNNFSNNPIENEVITALDEIKTDYDIIIAIGGGSVIDFAKAYKYYLKSNKKLIAIPTTFGTGSEATQFAVIYKNGVKTSLDDVSLLPQYSIVDSIFSETNSQYLKACTAMDAYCQAIESFWAVNATKESEIFAEKSIEIIKKYIEEYVNTNDEIAAEKMTIASHLAGKAINISRTTASHAISYKITSEYNIPHGHAVALTIAQLFNYNSNVTIHNCNHPKGAKYVKNKLNNLKELIASNTDEYFKSLFKAVKLETNFEKLGIKDLNLIAKSVNEERLKNNPVKLTTKDIYFLLTK